MITSIRLITVVGARHGFIAAAVSRNESIEQSQPDNA